MANFKQTINNQRCSSCQININALFSAPSTADKIKFAINAVKCIHDVLDSVHMVRQTRVQNPCSIEGQINRSTKWVRWMDEDIMATKIKQCNNFNKIREVIRINIFLHEADSTIQCPFHLKCIHIETIEWQQDEEDDIIPLGLEESSHERCDPILTERQWEESQRNDKQFH